MSLQLIRQNLADAQKHLAALIANEKALSAVDATAAQLISTFKNGGRVYSCGNGGSMCDAMHFAEELSARYRLDRPGLPAASISDPAHISCAANDLGYEFIFSRYIEAHAKKGDVLLAISTSGKSRNVIHAAEAAKLLGVHVVSLIGKPDSALEKISDIAIVTPGGDFADHVQELHIKVIHILIELVERSLFPANYKDGAA